MALSFSESLKAQQKKSEQTSNCSVNTTNDVSVASLNTESNDNLTMSLNAENDDVSIASVNDLDDDFAVYSNDDGIATQNEESNDFVVYSDENDYDGQWIVNSSYVWYSEYSDSKYSYVDESKNITVDPSQINLSQEENSQFIPFEIPRYYDGIDLKDKIIQIHYINSSNEEDYDNVVNVQYNNSKIRFAWLIDSGVTYQSGEISFEIRATGTNEKGDNYTWISRPNGKLNINKSLSGNGVVKPESDWYTGFINVMNSKISEATAEVAKAELAASSAENYASMASESAKQAKESASNVADSVKIEVLQSVNTTLEQYYNKDQVDSLLDNIDISDQLDEINTKIDSIDGLANFKVEYASDTNVMTFYNGDDVIEVFTLNSDPSDEWTTTYTETVETQITNAISPIQTSIDNNKKETDESIQAVQTSLDEYKTTTDADLKSIHTSIDDLPETLKTNYYDKDTTNELLKFKAESTTVTTLSSKISAVEEVSNSNKTSISTIGTKVASLEDSIGKLNTDPGMTYEATYDEENVYRLYEIKNEGEDNEERTVKSQFKIVGGSGGGGTSSTLKIEYVTKSPLIVTTNDKAIIKYNFSGQDSSGDEVTEGTYTWKLGSKIIATGTALSGENSFDASEYISIGTQKLLLSITDDAGSLVTKSWSVQKVDIRIDSTFNDKLTYPMGEVSFDYTPYGAVSKDIHFKLDGAEIYTLNTTASGIPMAYSIPTQTHGSHLVEVYITAEINGSQVESNHIYKDVIWYDSTSDVPVIACVSSNITVQQYDIQNIVYTVYDPNTETPTVTLAVDGNEISTLQLDANTNTWQYKPTEIGDHVLTITCRNTVKTINVTVEKLDIDVSPITANLKFDFNPVGKSNNDANRLWSDGDVAMTVSDNFDWDNGGYQLDENGDQYFGIKAGSTATISYNLFADDARRNGKEFKFIFKTTNVAKADATFLTCESDGIGLQMNVHEAYIKSSAKSLYVPYSENDIIEWEFNISKDTDIPIVMSYEDGTPCRPMSYTSDYSFTQETPVPITIGSSECDVLIYRMKAYNSSLTTTAIQSNFIADARTATEMVQRYKRNQIYDENGSLTPESVANACPNMRIIKIEAPYFTNDKKNYVKNTSMECIYKNGDPILDNWKYENCYHAGRT